MRQMIMTLAAVLLISSTALAQEKNENRKQEMIKHRTERTVKEYNLNDKQAKQLLELNTKYADMMRPMHRPGGPGRNGMKGQRPEPPKDMKGERPEPPKDMKGDRKELREKMQKDMKAYDEELQKIMTPEQYKKYKADMEKRRKEGPHGFRGDRSPQSK